jgi:hypothetical protein
LMNYLERHHPDLSRQIKHAKNRDEIDRGWVRVYAWQGGVRWACR